MISPCPDSWAPSSPSRRSHWRAPSPFLAVSPPGPCLPRGISRHLSLAAEPDASPTPSGRPGCSGVQPGGWVRNPSHLSPTEAASMGLGVPSAEASSLSARPSSFGWKPSTGVQMAHCRGGDCGGGGRLCLPLLYLGEAGRRGAAWPPALLQLGAPYTHTPPTVRLPPSRTGAACGLRAGRVTASSSTR